MPKKYRDETFELVEQSCNEFGMVQVWEELAQLLEFYEKLNVKRFMEIGTAYGGTFYLFCKFAPMLEQAISIDLYDPTINMPVEERNTKLKTFAKGVYTLTMDSHSEECLIAAKSILGEEKLDFLFIDGDHSYEGAKKDFDMYSSLVKSGGWVGFHDVTTNCHGWLGCADAWNEISRNKKVVMFDESEDFGGIGLIQL